MHWQIEENLAEIEGSLEAASAHDAHLVLFPEMSLIGLHTKLRELLDRTKLTEALGMVGAACRAHKVGAAVGAPLWLNGERPRNAIIVLDSDGELVETSSKLRLMPPGEPIVFERGNERPVFEWNGAVLAVVICREILDRRELAQELSQRARVILWPGTMARGPMDPSNPEDYTVHATELAKQQNAWVLHSNWARHVDAPGIPHTGKSMVIAPDGSVVLEAPAQAPGLLLAWESSLEKAWVTSGPGIQPGPPAA
jgi:predicted amidohydrolase